MALEERIYLGAYQFMDTQPIEHDQYEPGTLKVHLQTAIDVPFENHYITAILQPKAQAKIVRHFLSSVMTDDEFKLLLEEARRSSDERYSTIDTLFANRPYDEKENMRKHADRTKDLVGRLRVWFNTRVVEPY